MTTSKHFMRFLYVLCLFSSLGIVACNDRAKSTDSEKVAEERNEPKSDATKESDERFLVRAAEINLEEIQLGQLAQQKGTTNDVKSLGKMMAEEHTKALAALTSLAASKSIAVPTTPTQDVQDAYKKMSEKTGLDFDKDYCDRMVSGHKDAIDLFDNATKGNNDPDVKNWASSMMEGLRMHLASAQTCQDKLKMMK